MNAQWVKNIQQVRKDMSVLRVSFNKAMDEMERELSSFRKECDHLNPDGTTAARELERKEYGQRCNLCGRDVR